MTIAIGQLAPIALSVCVCIYMDVRPLHVSCRCRWLVNCARSESPAAGGAGAQCVCYTAGWKATTAAVCLHPPVQPNRHIHRVHCV
jgi:hypothetical protein